MPQKNEKKNNAISSEENARKNHEVLINIQQSEARLHWQRNNVFLIVSSILILVIGQIHDICIQIIICICGLALNIAWLLIQFSSSRYIHKWIEMAQELEKVNNIAPIFSKKPKGIPIRLVAFVLPIIFITLWIFLVLYITKSFYIILIFFSNLKR